MNWRPALMLAPAAVLIAASGGHAQDSAGGVSSAATHSNGRSIYVEICQACHMADARGGGGAGMGIPALADNPNMADKKLVIGVLVNGRGGMPWFTDMLSAEQIAAVLTYVRSDFNAYADPVTVAEVRAAIGSATAQ